MTDRDFAHAEHDRRIANLLRMGTVSEVDLAAGRARVQLGDDWVGDFLPWIEPRAGANLRTWSPPSVGEQVLVLAPSGELAGGAAILRGVYSDAAPAPSQSGDVTVLGQWEDQAVESYDAAAHVRSFTLPAGGQLVVQIGGAQVLELFGDHAVVAIGGTTLTLRDGQATLSAGTVELDGSIRLGGGGAAVARVGDKVDTKTGLILTGSGKVSAG